MSATDTSREASVQSPETGTVQFEPEVGPDGNGGLPREITERLPGRV